MLLRVNHLIEFISSDLLCRWCWDVCFFALFPPESEGGRFKELFPALKSSSLLLKIICLYGTNSEFQANFSSCLSGEVTVSNEFSSANVPDHVQSVACPRKGLIQLRILPSVSSASRPRNYVFLALVNFFFFFALVNFSICISRLCHTYRLTVSFTNLNLLFSSYSYSFMTWSWHL